MDIKRLKEMAGIIESEERVSAKPAEVKTVEQLQGVNEVDRMRKLAGLPLMERRNDDEDDEGLSRAERELASVADRDLKKKGVDVDAELAAARKREKAEKAAAAKPNAEQKPAAKAEAPAAEEKKEEKAAAKRGEGRGALRAWLSSHEGTATRAQFMAKAKEVGVGSGNASAMWQSMKSKQKVSEFYVIRHPSVSSFILAENAMFGRYQWLDENDHDDHLEIQLFETAEHAKKVLTHIENFKSMVGVVSTIKDEE